MIAADTPETEQRNFLSAFKKLRISDDEAESATKGLTEDEIISQVFVLFAAGYETSASLLQWAVYNICKDDDLQQKLFKVFLRREFVNPFGWSVQTNFPLRFG